MSINNSFISFPDTYAQSKPDLVNIGPHEILATWEAPEAPINRVNGYELLVNGKVVYIWSVYPLVFTHN